MYRMLRKWRLDALYGLDRRGSAGASAWRGFSPIKTAAWGAHQRIKDFRSPKSPIPQLSLERTVYSCTAMPHTRRPDTTAAGSKHSGGDTTSKQRVTTLAILTSNS